MKLRVVISKAREAASETKEMSGAYCLVGRRNATLTIDDPKVSQQHVLLFEGPDGRLWLRDLESTNGTFVNEQRAIERALELGDSVRVGHTTILILDFKSVRESTLTQATLVKKDNSKEKSVQRFMKSQTKENSTREIEIDSTPPNKEQQVVHQWPEAFKAHPQSFQERFVEYIDENGEMTRVHLKSLLKAA